MFRSLHTSFASSTSNTPDVYLFYYFFYHTQPSFTRSTPASHTALIYFSRHSAVLYPFNKYKPLELAFLIRLTYQSLDIAGNPFSLHLACFLLIVSCNSVEINRLLYVCLLTLSFLIVEYMLPTTFLPAFSLGSISLSFFSHL